MADHHHYQNNHTPVSAPSVDFNSIAENTSVGARIGCWLLIVSQHFLIDGMINSGISNNLLMLALLNEAIFLVLARKLVWLGVVRDMLDLTFWSLVIGLFFLIGFGCGELLNIPTGKLFYNNMYENYNVIAYFFLMTATIRLLWCFRSSKTGKYYRWLRMGPISYFCASGGDDTEETNRGAIAAALLMILLILAVSIKLAEQKETYDKLIMGISSVLLFLRFYYPYFMRSNTLMAAEVKNKILLEEAAKLTADLITENNHASETLDLVVEENNMLRRHMTETEEEFRRRFSPEQIDYLHKFSTLDEGLKDQISGILHHVWLAQQAKNESASPPPAKPQRPKPKLVLVPETGKNLPDKD